MDKRIWRETVLVVFLLCVATAAAPAQTFTSLVSFNGTNGFQPQYVALVQGTDGNLYGTTSAGGANSNCFLGCGTIFQVNPAGTLTTLYSFDFTDGARPNGGLILATDRNFYGSTSGGGTMGGKTGFGTIFKITPGGALTTLHEFNGIEGSGPAAAPTQAANGDFYGTTPDGGRYKLGTVYKYTLGGAFTMMHSFNIADGIDPQAGLIQATNGSLYGTAVQGGRIADVGTIFGVTPEGTLTTLYSFRIRQGGYYPLAGLLQGTGGELYGTTGAGGMSNGGTIFKLTIEGTFTTIYAFDGTDSGGPAAGLIQATDGSFYGTTGRGGSGGYGTIFQITPEGALTTLHSFVWSDGASPEGALVQGTDGDFYGTTTRGGANNSGTAFKLSTGLGPFVKTQTTSGKVGAPVTILGNNLTGTSSVTFNGTAAVFTVNSTGTAISTTVPAGATTGTVQVTLSGGSVLSSNVPFRVLP